MKKSLKNIVVGSLLSVGGAMLAGAAYRKLQKDTIRMFEELDKRNRMKFDQMVNVDASEFRARNEEIEEVEVQKQKE